MADQVRLTVFIYFLGRDLLPLGSIEKVMEQIEQLEKEPNYSNKHLESYAREIAERLSRRVRNEPLTEEGKKNDS